MTIRESLRRALRRSDLSDSSNSEAGSPNDSTTSSSKTSVSSKSSGSRLTRTWTWGSNKEKEPAKERKPKKTAKKRIVHPSERPLTEQNLRHQEMLSQFTWTFGASQPGQVQDFDFIGISPCCTRTPSLANYDLSGDSDGSSTSPDS
ncbi:hypothetical protein BGZ63DRAFT_420382 [Mariannaea sp. PMI_226]|nr:hypothetical protein BGZ63DRAFT_420382 [Mariannaea sp. PMI_226]